MDLRFQRGVRTNQRGIPNVTLIRANLLCAGDEFRFGDFAAITARMIRYADRRSRQLPAHLLLRHPRRRCQRSATFGADVRHGCSTERCDTHEDIALGATSLILRRTRIIAHGRSQSRRIMDGSKPIRIAPRASAARIAEVRVDELIPQPIRLGGRFVPMVELPGRNHVAVDN